MARDILKAKFACQGYDLRDDNNLYRGDKLIAKNVQVTEEELDCITFDFDLVVDDVDFGMPIKPKVRSDLH